MPLVKSKSKKAVGENIKREMAAGKPQKQAVAIALDVQRRAGKSHHLTKRAAKKARLNAKSNVSEYRT